MNKLKKLTITLVLINHINAPSPTTITAHDQLGLISTQIADRYTSSDKKASSYCSRKISMRSCYSKIGKREPCSSCSAKAAFDAKCQEFTASSGVVLSSHALCV